METGIHIGGKFEKDTAINIKDIITEIFRVGEKTRMDQETIRLALSTIHVILDKVMEVENITISDISVTGDTIAKEVKLDDES